MEQQAFDRLRLELSVNAKNGIDFIAAAAVIWTALGYVWSLPSSAYNRSILTFVLGTVLLPLAFAFSKVFKTRWKSPGNPLEPLGLWLNFAQLFYFPMLVFVLLTDPQHFIMTYAIITGAHLFPYAWFYKSMAYAVMAGVIAAGSMVLGLTLEAETIYLLPLAVAGALVLLAVLLVAAWRKNVGQFR